MITETSEVFGEGFIDPTDNVKYNRIYEKTAHSIVRNKSEARAAAAFASSERERNRTSL